ncbi:SDR family NAD(P)-dependent oxidoreductase [Alkalicoccus chagannorensis]|uniref:SDR family NAD(P)-dependent oxidoreductase n=1 Tax=Alkalicoccus chagannorensis TaxID=427072 RepID=UPI0003F5386D|nr:SDR family oxidoreductase [Alkalicoccus chagannorensis]
MYRAIVTGAAQGIGRTCADELEAAGYEVYRLDKQSGDKIHVVDVQNQQDIQTFFENLPPIHALINNAGLSQFTPLEALTQAEWDEVINTNLRGPLFMTQAMAAAAPEGSAVVNIVSTRALQSESGSEAYAASKGGLAALTHALAASLAPKNIRVNAVAPGWIHTGREEDIPDAYHELHWSGRVGRPTDVAKLCRFLLDEENDFMNGEMVTLDGGMTKMMRYDLP